MKSVKFFLILLIGLMLPGLAHAGVILLSHNPPASVVEGHTVKLSIDIKGYEDVKNIIVFFRGENETTYQAVFLFPKEKLGHYEGIIPSNKVNPPGIFYYIIAESKKNKFIPLFASKKAPQYIKVKKSREEGYLGGELGQYLQQGISEEVAYFKAEAEVESASGFKQKRSEAPASTFILYRRDLLKLGSFSLLDAFFYVPGMRLVRINASDIEPGIRGMAMEENKRVLTLINDRPGSVAFIGITPYMTFPLFLMDIDHIEVVEGPVSTIYGPNAYAGAINIYLRDPHREPGTYFYFAVGDKGLKSNTAEISSANVYGKVYTRMTVGWRRYEEFSRINVPEIMEGVNNPAKTYWGNFEIGKDLSNGYVELSGGLNSIDAETAAKSFLFQNNYGYFGYGRIDFKKGNWRTVAYLNYYDTGILAYIKPDTSGLTGYMGESFSLPPNIIDGYVRGSLGNVEAIYTNIFKENYKLRFTANYTFDYLNSPELFLKSYLRNMYGFSFLNEDHFLNGKLILNISFRYDYHPLTKEHMSPRFAIMFKPEEKHVIRLVGSSAYRNPTFVESDVNFDVPTIVAVAPGGKLLNPPQFVISPIPAKVKGNEDTKAETIYSLELDYEGRFFEKTLKGGINLYYNWYRDLIDLRQTSEGYSFGNIGNAHGYGTEVYLDWQPIATWRFFANYSFSRTYNEFDNPYTEENEKGLSKIYPEHIANAGIFFLPEKWELSLLAHYESEIEGYRDADNIPYLLPAVDPTAALSPGEEPSPIPELYAKVSPDVLYKVPPYYLLRARVAYLPTENLTFFVVGQNLLNYIHKEWPRDVAEYIGIRIFGGVIYKF